MGAECWFVPRRGKGHFSLRPCRDVVDQAHALELLYALVPCRATKGLSFTFAGASTSGDATLTLTGRA